MCGDEIDAGTMTIQKAIQLLCSSDDKYQAMGAYYLQHTCFQDESAKQEVSKPLQCSAVTLGLMAQEGWDWFSLVSRIHRCPCFS